jgi:uncharacterized caspase-like protein
VTTVFSTRSIAALVLASVFSIAGVCETRPVDPTSGTLRVLAIGVDKYGFATFRMSKSDANATIAVLREGGGKLFDAVETKALLDAQATRAGIVAAFEALVAAARPEDTVVVYFAGLAAESADSGEIHLLPSDATPEEFRFGPMPTAAIGEARIPGRQLAAWFSRMEARQQVLIFDTFTTTRGLDLLFRELNERDTMAGDMLGRGRLVVGLDGATVEDPALGHGLVTATLLAALSGEGNLGAIALADGVVTSRELEVALPSILRELSANETPMRARVLGEDFPIAGSTGSVRGSACEAASTRGTVRIDTPVEKAEPAVRAGREDYALLFASDVYDTATWKPLANPIHDARTLAKELRERYGFIVELVENPTWQVMRDRLQAWQQREYGPDDQLLVFFAGHGTYDELTREGFVIARDTGAGSSPMPALSNSQLRTAIDAIPCDHIMVIMDTCFGGTFDQAIGQAGHRGDAMYDDIAVGKLVERLLGYKSRVYLTSGGKQYVPDGRPGHHSPFAFKVLEALRGQAGRPGLVLWSDLVGHVKSLPVEPKAGTFGTPDPGADFVFVPQAED